MKHARSKSRERTGTRVLIEEDEETRSRFRLEMNSGHTEGKSHVCVVAYGYKRVVLEE